MNNKTVSALPKPKPAKVLACTLSGLLGVFAITTCLATPLIAEEEAEDPGWFRKNFIDPEDNALDVSEWLSKGGFLPVPLVITEPAVQNGLGLALGFIGKSDPGSKIPPNFTGLAAIATGNKSEVYAAFHDGTYFDGRFRLSGVATQADVNLDFFAGSSGGLAYNIDGFVGAATATYQLGNSNWYAGGTWRYLDGKVQFQGPSGGSVFPPRIDATLSGLGAVLDYYSLDNTFTPTRGTTARLSATRFDESLGSDYNYTQGLASAFTYFSPTERLTLGGKFVAKTVNGNAPFFALPAISLRGIPALRYQGDSTISTEVEATYQIAKRWRLAGFAGVGWADDKSIFADRSAKAAFGAGVRYRIADRLGIDLGLDVAQGPEETVVYLQFGRAWRRF